MVGMELLQYRISVGYTDLLEKSYNNSILKCQCFPYAKNAYIELHASMIKKIRCKIINVEGGTWFSKLVGGDTWKT